MHRRIIVLCAAVAATALLSLPAVAGAYTVTVKMHGVGQVAEIPNRFGESKNQTGCNLSPSGRSESSLTDCVMGSASGLWNSGNVVRLSATVPQTAYDRGWRFLRWVDGTAAKQINCDPQGTVGTHAETWCEFQIFDNLYIDLYFDDVLGPQDTAITSGPATPTNQSGATFDFKADSDPDATFECSLERHGQPVPAYYACGGPFDKTEGYSGLTDGQYTFRVRGVDASGNVDETPSTRTWTVDTAPPVAGITGGPVHGSTVSSKSVAFTPTMNEAGTLTCALDGVFSPCASGLTKSYPGPLSEGTHTFTVVATDAAGNTGGASRTWTIDSIDPVPSISGGPTGATAATSATFTLATNEGALSCSLDGEVSPCGPGARSYPGPLSEGSHTFTVTATDAAGNTGTDSRTWTVDTTGPAVTFTAGPVEESTIPTSSTSFGFGAGETATFECSRDGGAFSSCGSPQEWTGLADGRHTFAVRARDALGNLGATATRAFTVKVPPPTVDSQPTVTPSPAVVAPVLTLPLVKGDVRSRWRRSGKRTRVVSLLVRGLDANARVTVSCSGGGCPFKSRSAKPSSKRTVDVKRLLKGRLLRAKAKLAVRITSPGTRARVWTFTMRAGKLPSERRTTQQ